MRTSASVPTASPSDETVPFPDIGALSSVPSASSASHNRVAEVKVMAYYLSPTDILHLQSHPNQLKFSRPACTLVPLNSSSPSPAAASFTSASSFDVLASYAIVFDYGAIVFFNASEAAQAAFFNSLPNKPSSRLKDDYTVIVDPNMTSGGAASALPAPSGAAGAASTSAFSSSSLFPAAPLFSSSAYAATTASPSVSSSVSPSALNGASSAPLSCHFGTDSLYLSSLDPYSVRIIAQILAQTVGMEHYEHRTSLMLSEFHALSLAMQSTGTLPHSSSTQLVQLLAQNNTILTTVLTHLRLLDRSEIAWRYGRYDSLWAGLRREFDMEGRWETLETKLRLLHENHPLFLEVLHHKQGTRMEIIIIALIAIEVLLALVFHSPVGKWMLQGMGFAAAEDDDK